MPGEGVLRADRVRIDGHGLTYLAHANVLSEPTKPDPDPGVIDSLRRNERELVVDPFILGEIKFGILLLPAGRRRTRWNQCFDEGVGRIRCLAWEAPAGLRWAQLIADLRKRGLAMPIKDSLIAATALAHDLTLASRNQRDFANAGVKVVNPSRRHDLAAAAPLFPSTTGG
jgi:toxin FitB